MTEAPQDSIRYTSTPSERGGTLTVEYKTDDVVANTLGHVLAIAGTHIPFLTLNHVFENAPPELAQALHDRWKDVPWRGDYKVRVGHSSLWDELDRSFSLDAAKGRPNFFTRMIGLPWTGLSWLGAKLFRYNYFNPFTNAATIYHPHEAFGMHEMGRAQFYDEHKHSVYLRILGALTRLPVASFFEWKSSANAMKRFESDAKREEALKVLEPRFGLTLLTDLFVFATPFIPGPVSETSRAIAEYAVRLAGAERLAKIGGLVAGHILSRLPNKRERFGWVFGGQASHG